MIGRRRNQQVYTTVRRASEHYRSEQPGIRSVHSFAAGAHFDAANTAFGALVGLDEHTLDPGAGFERHPHRGVTIVTWVLTGALHHSDDGGGRESVPAGSAAVQVAGRGIRHVEANASSADPVRFIQVTLLAGIEDPSYRIAALPVIAANSLFEIHREGRLILEGQRMVAHVISGEFRVGKDVLQPGDQLRATQEAVTVEGSGEAIVLILR